MDAKHTMKTEVVDHTKLHEAL